MKETIKNWLEQGKVDVFIACREVRGHCLPWFYSKDKLDELDDFVTGPNRYPLEKMALKLARKDPDLKIGLVARDCNQRALKVYGAFNQMAAPEVIPLGCCPSSLKQAADCSHLRKKPVGEVKKQMGMDNNLGLDDLKAMPPAERWQRWSHEFSRCIKCYGCRDICPVCFCKECSLEHPEVVTPGRLPVEIPMFHLVRAVHMAGRCIDCGLCEQACPADIPLRLLYSEVSRIMDTLFDFRAGEKAEQSPLSFLELENQGPETEPKLTRGAA